MKTGDHAVENFEPMTVESVSRILEEAGAKVSSRSGRSENYGAPRDFSFEVRAIFPNGMGLHVLARQFNYREAWEGGGRVNDMVDVSLLRCGGYSSLPKGYQFFQDTDIEERVDDLRLREMASCIAGLNPKVYLLQEATGDL